MTNIFRKLLGGDGINEQIVNDRFDEAEEIKKVIRKDSLKKKKQVDTINLNTYRKLQKISDDLADVTYTIAIATGAKKRGYRP